MADYTDGLGWAKLDTTAACHLADCIRLFTGRAASNRTRMLLYCFSRMREHKTGPSFQVGYRQLAKDCGVTEETAKQFIKFCEKEEIFSVVGETPKGKTPQRAFYWLNPDDDRCVVQSHSSNSGWGVQTTQGGVFNPMFTTRGCVVQSHIYNAHKDTEYQREESSKSDLSSPASYVSADATTEAGQMTTEVHFLRTEDVQPREDAIEVPQAEFDAQEERFRQGIQEALDNIEQSKARSIDWEWHLYRESHKPVAGDGA